MEIHGLMELTEPVAKKLEELQKKYPKRDFLELVEEARNQVED
jgi:hypothetical protein